MFSKLISFCFIYILSLVNFIIILSPLLALLIPLLFVENLDLSQDIISLLLLSAVIVSVLMFLLLLLDFLFGFSIRSFLKNCVNYKKNKDLVILEGIFNEVQDSFGQSHVKLLIQNTDIVNAFAVGSMWRKNVVITQGLISRILMNTSNNADFLKAIKGIIGHEMSHLVNKDYLPGLLLRINEQATFFVSKIIFVIFTIVVRILSIIPFVGVLLGNILISIYKMLNFLIVFFHKYIIINLYKFIQLQISKGMEYRCDRQSAKACGGNVMAYSLSFLGDNGYFTIFSTHPSTKKRIIKAQKVQKKEKGIIRASLFNQLANAFSVLFIVYFALICFVKADVPDLAKKYGGIMQDVKDKAYQIKDKSQQFINDAVEGLKKK